MTMYVRMYVCMWRQNTHHADTDDENLLWPLAIPDLAIPSAQPRFSMTCLSRPLPTHTLSRQLKPTTGASPPVASSAPHVSVGASPQCTRAHRSPPRSRAHHNAVPLLALLRQSHAQAGRWPRALPSTRPAVRNQPTTNHACDDAHDELTEAQAQVWYSNTGRWVGGMNGSINPRRTCTFALVAASIFAKRSGPARPSLRRLS